MSVCTYDSSITRPSGLFCTFDQSTASATPPPVALRTPSFIASPSPTLIPPKVLEDATGKVYSFPTTFHADPL